MDNPKKQIRGVVKMQKRLFGFKCKAKDLLTILGKEMHKLA